MKVLVIGAGGREHALVWKLRESQLVTDIYCAPGNPGIGQEAECLAVDLSSPDSILDLARRLSADLTIVGPEGPLVAGVADLFSKAGLRIIGPSKAAARLEGSKAYAKRFMQKYGIPTARFVVAENFANAVRSLGEFRLPVVVKADGLAAGKGVVVARRREDAEKALDDFMRQGTLGAAGERVVIEECLDGDELSFIVLADSRGILPLAPSQDYKPVFDHDEGPNTGGMGASSHDAIISSLERDAIVRSLVRPAIEGMAAEGTPYRGFLYCGLMLTVSGPKVLEFNCRLGDPETQPIMMRLRSDLVELLLATWDGHLGGLEAHWTPNPSVCVVLASRGYPGEPEVGKVVVGVDAAEALGGVKVFFAGTKMSDKHLITTSGRVLGVTAIGQDLASAVQRAYAGVSKIQFEGMHYRHDIGSRTPRGFPGPQSSSQPPRPGQARPGAAKV
ncbi:MAG: phosphoribosylamine--glycine ligase [Acidobacteria bacterium]|nr:MAG: phosphoribosylamine--glycine ligase [Acidobacteriota bacterium]